MNGNRAAIVAILKVSTQRYKYLPSPFPMFLHAAGYGQTTRWRVGDSRGLQLAGLHTRLMSAAMQLILRFPHPRVRIHGTGLPETSVPRVTSKL